MGEGKGKGSAREFILAGGIAGIVRCGHGFFGLPWSPFAAIALLTGSTILTTFVVWCGVGGVVWCGTTCVADAAGQ
jgi:hypothetical protein